MSGLGSNTPRRKDLGPLGIVQKITDKDAFNKAKDKFEKEWYLSSESISNINVYTNEKPSAKSKEDRETKTAKAIIELNKKVMKSISNLAGVTKGLAALILSVFVVVIYIEVKMSYESSLLILLRILPCVLGIWVITILQKASEYIRYDLAAISEGDISSSKTDRLVKIEFLM